MVVNQLLLLLLGHRRMQKELALEVLREHLKCLGEDVLDFHAALLAATRIERMAFKVACSSDASGNDLALGKVGKLRANVGRVEVHALFGLTNLESDMVLLDDGVEELAEVVVALFEVVSVYRNVCESQSDQPRDHLHGIQQRTMGAVLQY